MTQCRTSVARCDASMLLCCWDVIGNWVYHGDVFSIFFLDCKGHGKVGEICECCKDTG